MKKLVFDFNDPFNTDVVIDTLTAKEALNLNEFIANSYELNNLKEVKEGYTGVDNGTKLNRVRLLATGRPTSAMSEMKAKNQKLTVILSLTGTNLYIVLVLTPCNGYKLVKTFKVYEEAALFLCRCKFDVTERKTETIQL